MSGEPTFSQALFNHRYGTLEMTLIWSLTPGGDGGQAHLSRDPRSSIFCQCVSAAVCCRSPVWERSTSISHGVPSTSACCVSAGFALSWWVFWFFRLKINILVWITCKMYLHSILVTEATFEGRMAAGQIPGWLNRRSTYCHISALFWTFSLDF